MLDACFATRGKALVRAFPIASLGPLRILNFPATLRLALSAPPPGETLDGEPAQPPGHADRTCRYENGGLRFRVARDITFLIKDTLEPKR